MTDRIDNSIIDCEFAYINKQQGESAENRRTGNFGNNPKILVVEDNKLILDHLVSALENAGYNVLAFCDAESAVPVIKELGGQIAVAIIDDILPKLHGHELLRLVNPYIQNTKIILTSGYYSDDCRVPLLDNAQMIFMHKPYKLTDLIEKVRGFAPLNTNSEN